MNRNLLIIIVVIVVGVVAYFLFTQNNQPSDQTSTETEEAMTSLETVITLSEQNSSGESGTATFTEENGQVKVTLNLIGAPDGVTQPAHIHVGVCPDVGEVKYPLTSPVDGVSETVLDVTLDQLESELPLGLNVHKSADEANIYVSCGDLAL